MPRARSAMQEKKVNVLFVPICSHSDIGFVREGEVATSEPSGFKRAFL